eukprot:PhM_4_TR14841/c0_g1_i1/m.82895
MADTNCPRCNQDPNAQPLCPVERRLHTTLFAQLGRPFPKAAGGAAAPKKTLKYRASTTTATTAPSASTTPMLKPAVTHPGPAAPPVLVQSVSGGIKLVPSATTKPSFPGATQPPMKPSAQATLSLDAQHRARVIQEALALAGPQRHDEVMGVVGSVDHQVKAGLVQWSKVTPHALLPPQRVVAGAAKTSAPTLRPSLAPSPSKPVLRARSSSSSESERRVKITKTDPTPRSTTKRERSPDRPWSPSKLRAAKAATATATTKAAPASSILQTNNHNSANPSEQARKIADRRSRFQESNSSAGGGGDDDDDFYIQTKPVLSVRTSDDRMVGLSKSLEKSYFRLQEMSRPEDVRPEPVLKEAFVFVQQKFKKMWDEATSQQDRADAYRYLNGQYKGIRQDLVVQQVANEFTLDVLETHARLCLEMGELTEFNQSQSRIKELHAVFPHREPQVTEFIVYRLVYCALAGNASGSAVELRQLDEHWESQDVTHAIAMMGAIAGDNYALLLRLTRTAPYKLLLLVSAFLPKLWIRWLRKITQSFGPQTVSLQAVREWLGFDLVESTPGAASNRMEEFLTSMNAVFDGDVLRTRETLQAIDKHLTFLTTREDAPHARLAKARASL